jgi:hypothetical protein
MSMAFCRGCGKEIHLTATTCPQCGALQRIAANSNGTSFAVKAVLCMVGWVLCFWVVPILWVAFWTPILNPGVSPEVSGHIGGLMSAPMLMLSFILTAILSFQRKLPGTKKQSS